MAKLMFSGWFGSKADAVARQVEAPAEQALAVLWNVLVARLSELGWSEDQIEGWIQSNAALDGDLGDTLRALGRTYAERIASVS